MAWRSKYNQGVTPLIRSYALVNAAGLHTDQVTDRVFAGGESPLGPASEAFPRVRHAQVGEVLAPEPVPEFAPQYDTRVTRLAMMVARPLRETVEALVQRYGPARVVLLLATSTGGLDASERWFTQRDETPDEAYLYYEKHLIHVAADCLCEYFGLTSTTRVVSTACSSSAKIAGMAIRMFQTGEADAAVLVGVDSLCHTTVLGFIALGAMSPSRTLPFSAARDGMQIGEGAAALVLEASTTAPADPQTLALTGVGETSDGYHLSSPDPSGNGATRAVRAALAQACVEPREVGYINAHGTGTPHNDAAEACAMRACFATEGPDGCPPVSSTKPMTGHLLGAAGLTEIILTCEAIRRGVLPPNVTRLPLDPACDLPVVLAPRPATIDVALSNSFGFGGSNAAVVLCRSSHASVQRARARSSRAREDRERSLQSGAPSLSILRHAFFSPVAASALALSRGERHAWAAPTFSWVTGRTRRFLSLTTQMALEVAGQVLPTPVVALESAEVRRNEVRSVFASVHGEIQTGVFFLEAMARGEALSPARFAQSVHNTPSGVFAIAAENRAFSTMISAGPHSVAAALLEASMLLALDPAPVLVVVTDESVPEVFQAGSADPPFAAAWLVGRVGAAGREADVSLEQAARDAPCVGAPTMLPSAMAVCSALTDAARSPARVRLSAHRHVDYWASIARPSA